MNFPSPVCRVFPSILSHCLHDHCSQFSCFTGGLITLFGSYSSFPKYLSALLSRHPFLAEVGSTTQEEEAVYKNLPSQRYNQCLGNVYSEFLPFVFDQLLPVNSSRAKITAFALRVLGNV